MVDRISTTTRYAQLIADMKMNEYNFNKLTAQLSSGKKFTSITEDPIASVNILNTNRQLGQIETFEQNVGMAEAELTALDDLMSLATGYLSNAWDRAIQANTQTYGKDSLEALKTEIDEITKTMVDLANSEYNDNYIFSGANTKTVTYTVDENGNIIYNGTPHSNPDYIRQTEVADGVFEVINTTGDKIFGWYSDAQAQTEDGKNIFLDAEGKEVYETVLDDGTKTYAYADNTPFDAAKFDELEPKTDCSGALGALKMLSNSIQMVLDGDTAEGYKKMNSTLDMFAESHNSILNEQTKFGGVANRLEMTNSTLETSNENLTSYLSNIQEVDYAQAVTQWMNAQYAYQASMQIASASMNMSLLNYMQ